MFRSNHTVDLSLSIERRRGALTRSERHKVHFETTRPGTLGRWIDTAREGNDIVITDPAQLVPVRIDPEINPRHPRLPPPAVLHRPHQRVKACP